MPKPPRYYYNSWGGWGDLGTNTSILVEVSPKFEIFL